MSGTSHDHAEAHSVTDGVHQNSWSASLEHPEHADDRELIKREAVDAIHNTAAGYHVNLVTHGEQGHPERYLYPHFEDLESELDIDWEYVEQCGCGGHVTRVYVK